MHIEGTATGAGSSRTGKGKLASALKGVPLGDNVFRFTDTQAGQLFRLYDSEGNLMLRDRGLIRFTFDFDTLGDDEPGGVEVQELEPSVRGPHPGFEDETLCPVLVPLLTGP